MMYTMNPTVCRGVFVTGNTSTTSGPTVTLSRDQSIYCVVLQYDVLNELPLCAGACLTGNTSTTSGPTVTLSRDQSSDCIVLQYDVLNLTPLCAGACL